MLSALKRFLINDWNRAKAAKRGGQHTMISLDAQTAEGRYRLEAIDQTTPDKLFDQSWAMTLLEAAQEQLRRDYESTGRGTLFDQLKVFLSGDRAPISFAEASGLIGMSESAAKVAVHRLRARYRECLRGQIAQTVSTAAEVDDEILHLFQIFSA
jgi:RNA polymerase sigma-70 factor (ECF subfamily)